MCVLDARSFLIFIDARNTPPESVVFTRTIGGSGGSGDGTPPTAGNTEKHVVFCVLYTEYIAATCPIRSKRANNQTNETKIYFFFFIEFVPCFVQKKKNFLEFLSVINACICVRSSYACDVCCFCMACSRSSYARTYPHFVYLLLAFGTTTAHNRWN